MKQLLLALGFVAVFLFPAQPAGASNPVIQGEVSGVEVCAQFCLARPLCLPVPVTV